MFVRIPHACIFVIDSWKIIWQEQKYTSMEFGREFMKNVLHCCLCDVSVSVSEHITLCKCTLMLDLWFFLSSKFFWIFCYCYCFLYCIALPLCAVPSAKTYLFWYKDFCCCTTNILAIVHCWIGCHHFCPIHNVWV